MRSLVKWIPGCKLYPDMVLMHIKNNDCIQAIMVLLVKLHRLLESCVRIIPRSLFYGKSYSAMHQEHSRIND